MVRPRHSSSGFTLIEVLAALAVFSIAILALIQTSANSARTVAALETKMLAGVVADNQITLTRANTGQPSVRTGSDTQMSQKFDYRVETTTTDVPNFFRITVKVRRADDEQVITTRTAFFTPTNLLTLQGATP